MGRGQGAKGCVRLQEWALLLALLLLVPGLLSTLRSSFPQPSTLNPQPSTLPHLWVRPDVLGVLEPAGSHSLQVVAVVEEEASDLRGGGGEERSEDEGREEKGERAEEQGVEEVDRGR